MLVLGIRISPQKTRYALVKSEGAGYELINADAESRLVYPTDMKTPERKVGWLYQELECIVRENSDVSKVCIKINEFGCADRKSTRETYYLEGGALLFCCRKSIPVTMRNYRSLRTNRKTVKDCAEKHVGATTRYWDIPMADAVVAAWREHQNSD